MHKNEGGYARLVALMVTTTIIAILFLRMYLEPKPVSIVEADGNITTTTTNAIDAYHANIDKAAETQKILNQRGNDLNAAMEE